MRIGVVLLLSVIAFGSLDAVRVFVPITGATQGTSIEKDTSVYLNVGDLKILDTIRPSGRVPKDIPDPSALHLGSDTIIVIGVTPLPPYSFPPDRVAPGQPPSGGMRLSVTVYAKDTTSRELHMLRLAYADCPAELRVFRTPERRGRPAWSSRSARDTLACPALNNHNGNGFETVWPASGILGDSLPPARYFFNVAVRLADGRVRISRSDSAYLTADPRPPTRDLSVVRFSASTAVTGLGPRMLRTRIVATNISRRLVELDYGSCALSVSMFSVSKPSVAPVWRSDQRGPRRRPSDRPPGYPGYVCTAELRMRILPPADSNVFTLNVPLAEILADSLPFGRYGVVANLRLVDRELPASKWGLDRSFSLGEVTLLSMADSFPRSRTLEGLRYTATARLVRGDTRQSDTVRTMVLVTNTTRRPITAQVPTECPVIAYAYRTTAERDSLPLTRRPAWAAISNCYRIMRRVELLPGKRLLLHVDKPVANIGDQSPSGLYYLLAWVGGIPDVMLNAGTVDLER